MHAVVVRLTINDLDADLDALRRPLVPQLSKAPVFVAGFWTRKGNTGLSMDHLRVRRSGRRRSRASAIRNARDVATLEDIEVREVIAHA